MGKGGRFSANISRTVRFLVKRREFRIMRRQKRFETKRFQQCDISRDVQLASHDGEISLGDGQPWWLGLAYCRFEKPCMRIVHRGKVDFTLRIG